MKIKIVKNKYLNVLFVLMLFSAAAHMIILICLAVFRGDIYILNYFNILDLDILFPTIFYNDFLENILSFIFAGILYILILKLNKPNEI